MVKNVAVVPEVCDHDEFLSKFGEKDRKSITRHLELFEEKFGRPVAKRWCRIAHVLMTLAPHPAKFVAQQAVQFYVPDGKYRMQVFALQATIDGALAVYASDVLAEGIRQGILLRPKIAGEKSYRIRNSDDTLVIDQLDGKTAEMPAASKAMTGWNRKAICITLPADATSAQVQAAESLCALSATAWDVAPQPV